MKTYIVILLTLAFTAIGQACGQEYKYLETASPKAGVSASSGIEKPVEVKVIYDNYLYNKDLKEDWGYSIYIEGLEKEVLFDTGTQPEIFVSNFRKMIIDENRIDFLVLSHEHGDHTGGVPAFTGMKNNIPVLIPYSFSNKYKNTLTDLKLEPILVKTPALICRNLYTSGEFEGPIPEQALVMDTRKGLVVMTGCSHPGIVDMLGKIRTDFGKNIFMVFGGFHLMDKSDEEIMKIISEMKTLGVVKVGATHCTGDRQIKMFREAYGDGYVELGVGNILTIY
ncbi:MAG: MBL fold metallo-hydrolase [Bacteroidales bacterium]|nr:MBL fold metallo-hydrolase [Bacteroidales bacterium]